MTGTQNQFYVLILPWIDSRDADAFDDNKRINDSIQSAFGSSHAIGFYTTNADGSVHFLNYDVNSFVFLWLCVRNDGENSFDLQKFYISGKGGNQDNW